ncbi:MAG: flagellar basal body-associated FliL family protein [Stellaceae bacterium]
MARQLEKGRVAAAGKGRAATVEAPPPEPAKKKPFKLILIAVVVLLIGAGGGWYVMYGKAKPGGTEKPAPALPIFATVKPIVITLKATDGSMHYAQLAMSLEVPSAAAIKSADAVMPEIIDMIRQSVLAYKADQLQTPQGVNKLRAALVTGANEVLLKSLGAAKVTALGGKHDALVSAIYFSNLVIQ